MVDELCIYTISGVDINYEIFKSKDENIMKFELNVNSGVERKDIDPSPSILLRCVQQTL